MNPPRAAVGMFAQIEGIELREAGEAVLHPLNNPLPPCAGGSFTPSVWRM